MDGNIEGNKTIKNPGSKPRPDGKSRSLLDNRQGSIDLRHRWKSFRAQTGDPPRPPALWIPIQGAWILGSKDREG